MTELDEGLLEFKNLVNLNLCGNCLDTIDGTLLPPGIRSLELQANRISDIGICVEHLPFDLLYLGLARNLLRNGKIIRLFEGHSNILLYVNGFEIPSLFWQSPLNLWGGSHFTSRFSICLTTTSTIWSPY